MRKALPAAAAVAVALTLFNAVPAFATVTPAPDPVVVDPGPVDPAPVDPPAADPAPVDPGPVDPGPVDPAPVDPGPVDPGPVDPGPVDPGDPEPTTVPQPTDIPTTQPTTPAPTVTNPIEPTETTTTPTSTTTETTSAGPTTSITNIKVDVDIDDRDDFSVHYTDNSTIYIEGDTYNNTYVYTGADGLTYRGSGLSCWDFDNIDDAQRVVDDLGAWAYLLDSDFDGVACEPECGEFIRNTGYDLGVRYYRGGQVDVWPSGAIDTGVAA